MNAIQKAALRRSIKHYYNFIDCPGSMTATMPYQDVHAKQTWGCITVHIPDLLDALTYLKRRYNVIATSTSNHWGAIIIHIEVRERKHN